MRQVLSTIKERWDNFISKATEKFGDWFDFSYSEKYFKDHKTLIPVTCNKHGISYKVKPDHFLHSDYGCCTECKKERDFQNRIERLKIKQVELIKKFREVHGDRYDYSKVDLVDAILNNKNKITVICPVHGEYQVDYNSHLSGVNCIKCISRYTNHEEFIAVCKKLYGDKYSYEKTHYINSTTKVTITCTEHNCDFEVLPLNFTRTDQSHFSCPECDERVLDTESFIKRATSIYGNAFDYSKSIYVTAKTPITIICNNCGAEISIYPDHFIRRGGKKWKYDLPYVCKCHREHESTLETETRELLTSLEIPFKKEKTYPDLKDRIRLKMDFFINSLNLVIECQGVQHYSVVDYFGGEEGLKYRIYHDDMKNEYCKKNNIKLIYYLDQSTYDQYIVGVEKYANDIFITDINDLKNYILNLL